MLKNTLLLLSLSIQFVIAQDYHFYAISNDANTEMAIYFCKLNAVIGTIKKIEQYSGTTKGDYLALSANNKHLLATSKNSSLDQSGLVQFDVAEDGSLSYVKEEFKSVDDQPCHVSFTPDMQYAFSANYGGDEISLYYFGDNTLSPEIDNIVKPDQSKGHFICTDPSGKFVHAVFLGLNKIFNYTIENNKFVANTNQEFFSVPDGYGPRHLVFHHEKDFVYILNETNSSVTACSYNSETGVITEIQNISMLPDGYSGNTNAAAIRIHPNGKFLYASNRGHNSIAVYEIAENGQLTFVEHETLDINFPRDFNISPDGKYMLIGNQKGNSIISLTINEVTGELTNTGVSLLMPSPVSIVFLGEKADSTNLTSTFNKTSLDKPLVVYPNPSDGILHFELLSDLQTNKIEVYTMNGQLLKIIEQVHTNTIDVSGLPSGTYMMTVYATSKIYKQQVIIR